MASKIYLHHDREFPFDTAELRYHTITEAQALTELGATPTVLIKDADTLTVLNLLLDPVIIVAGATEDITSLGRYDKMVVWHLKGAIGTTATPAALLTKNIVTAVTLDAGNTTEITTTTNHGLAKDDYIGFSGAAADGIDHIDPLRACYNDTTGVFTWYKITEITGEKKFKIADLVTKSEATPLDLNVVTRTADAVALPQDKANAQKLSYEWGLITTPEMYEGAYGIYDPI